MTRAEIRVGLWIQQWSLFGCYCWLIFAGRPAWEACAVFAWTGLIAWARALSPFERVQAHVMTWMLTVHLKEPQ